MGEETDTGSHTAHESISKKCPRQAKPQRQKADERLRRLEEREWGLLTGTGSHFGVAKMFGTQ